MLGTLCISAILTSLATPIYKYYLIHKNHIKDKDVVDKKCKSFIIVVFIFTAVIITFGNSLIPKMLFFK